MTRSDSSLSIFNIRRTYQLSFPFYNENIHHCSVMEFSDVESYEDVWGVVQDTECVFCHKEKTAVWFFFPHKKRISWFSHIPARHSDSAFCDSGGERCAARGRCMNYLSIYNVQDSHITATGCGVNGFHFLPSFPAASGKDGSGGWIHPSASVM